MTTVGVGATVGSSSPAAVRSPLHIARSGARSNRRSQATVRSLLLKALAGCLFVRRHVRETDDRIGLRFGPRPGADPTVHHTSKSSRCHGGTPVRRRCVGSRTQCVHFTAEERRHRRSEWAGVSWPMDDDRERDAAGGTGSAPVRKTVDAVALARTRRFARSFAPWLGRPHASASSWN